MKLYVPMFQKERFLDNRGRVLAHINEIRDGIVWENLCWSFSLEGATLKMKEFYDYGYRHDLYSVEEFDV